MITETETKLTAADRCDRCSARALVRAVFLKGELQFCGHHARETGYNLLLKAVTVYDPEGLLSYEDH
jgi:hypothetical protein